MCKGENPSPNPNVAELLSLLKEVLVKIELLRALAVDLATLRLSYQELLDHARGALGMAERMRDQLARL